MHLPSVLTTNGKTFFYQYFQLPVLPILPFYQLPWEVMHDSVPACWLFINPSQGCRLSGSDASHACTSPLPVEYDFDDK